MKLILNPNEKLVIFTDDEGYLIDNFKVTLANPHTLFIKLKDKDIINSYKITFNVVCKKGKQIPVYDYEYKGNNQSISEKTTFDIIPDEQVEHYHFIPNYFLKDYKC